LGATTQQFEDAFKCFACSRQREAADLLRINAAYDEVKNSIRRGAENAIKAGRLLLEAKATVGHGLF
jgi:Protein of unknown function (DUF3102)